MVMMHMLLSKLKADRIKCMFANIHMNSLYTTVKKMIPPVARRFFKPMYQWFGLRAFVKPTFVPLHCADQTVSLLVDPINGSVDEYIFMHHQWEEPIARLLSEQLVEGSVLVDVGANIGAFTIPMAKHVCDAGRVFAFEPHPRLVTQIEKSLKYNVLQNTTVINKACGATVGEQTLYVKSKNVGGSSLVASLEQDERVPLRVTTLDIELADVEKIDVIKIDVEGYELEVLQGTQNIIRTHRPVLVIEFSPSLYEARSKTIGLEIFELITASGYSILEVERGLCISDIPKYLHDIGLQQVNLLCTPA